MNPAAIMADGAGVRVTSAYPLELHHIKALFVAKKYRRCIQACDGALSATIGTESPSRYAFINFYLGSCNDELARVIHECSPAKLVYYNNAEAFYNEAIRALQAARSLRQTLADEQSANEIPSNENDAASISPCPTRQPLLSRSQPLSPLHSSPLGSPTHIHASISTCSEWESPSSIANSPDSSESERSIELNAPITPPRMLQTGFSCISLLDASAREIPPQLSRLPPLQREISKMSLLEAKAESRLPHSISQTLLRPITLGCSPKPRKSRVPVNVSTQCKEPKTPARAISGTKRDQLAGSLSSDISRSIPPGSLTRQSTTAVLNACMVGERAMAVRPEIQSVPKRFDEQIKAMCIQIETHLRLLTKAKSQALVTQNKRSAIIRDNVDKINPSIQNRTARFASSDSGLCTDSKIMSKSRSYWSFSTEDVKGMEKEKIIDAGRLRRWKKDRFDPKKYQDLAELALTEI